MNGLWKAGVPCLPYGPGGGSESDTIPYEYTRTSDRDQVARVLALTALDMCNRLRKCMGISRSWPSGLFQAHEMHF